MKLDILFHYEVNTETGAIEYLGKEEVKVDTGIKTKKSTDSSMREDIPFIQLNQNNLALNNLAIETLKIKVGDTIHINYPKKGDRYVPVIGSSENLGVKAGNKLLKNFTISFRGSANTRLSEFGTNFELVESERPGVFYLKGDKVVPTEDKKEVIEIDDDFELDDLDDLDLDDNSTDISTIDLTL